MKRKDSKYCMCLYYSSNALARVITKMAEEEFAVTGLAPSYAFLIMSINEEPGICPKELSEIMQLSPSTITRFLEKLEHRGLIKKKSEGKYTKVYPTDCGIELNERIKEAWMSLYNRTTKSAGKEEVEKLAIDIYNMKNKLK